MENTLAKAVEPFLLEERLQLVLIEKMFEICEQLKEGETKDSLSSLMIEMTDNTCRDIGIKVANAIMEDIRQ